MRLLGINHRQIPLPNKTIFRLGRIDNRLDEVSSTEVRWLLDLRHESERKPNESLNLKRLNIAHVPFPIFDVTPMQSMKFYSEGVLFESYCLCLKNNREQFKKAFEFAQNSNDVGAITCYSGKDRTGLLCFLLLWKNNVSTTLISEDYAQSRHQLLQNISLFEKNWVKRGLSQQEYATRILSPSTIPQRLETWIIANYGSLNEYLRL